MAGLVYASLACAGALDGTPLRVDYTAVQMTTGDVFARAAVFGPSGQASGSAFYAKTQPGVEDAAVLLALEYPGGPTGGYWSIGADRGTWVTTVEHHDATPQTWTLPSSACAAHTY